MNRNSGHVQARGGRTRLLSARGAGTRLLSHVATSSQRVRLMRKAEAGLAAAVAIVLAAVFLSRPSTVAAQPGIEQPDLNVAAVPAADSIGFFVALHEGLFAARGLHVTFIPAVSSETVIDDQELAEPGHRVDISCGNYVSYIEAQQAWNSGQRPAPSDPAVVAADLDIFAEGSIMQAGAQGLYVMPGSRIRTLADLEGKTIGVNAPGNILYLLVASVLHEHGLSVSGVHFAYYPLPEMAEMLAKGKISAAVLPEPFATEADESLGVAMLADLNQGATSSFPVEGCAVTRQWAALHPVTLAAFRAAFEQGQQIADSNREAVQKAMETLPAPLAVTPGTAAMMTLDTYPVGPVDAVRLQRVADVMHQFLSFPKFAMQTMIGGG